MRKVLKWIGIVVGGLVGLVVLGGVALYVTTGVRLNKTYDVQPASVTIPTDEAAIERGRQWVSVSCVGCHSDGLSGMGDFFDDPALGHIEASNLTSGQGGIGGVYSDADWVRALRHGVCDDGKPLLIMPSGALCATEVNDALAVI